MSADVTITVVETPEEAAAEAARVLVDAARAGGSIVLAGGSTPRRAYELAAATEPDWGRASVWLGDERVVADGDERSNAALVRAALLDRLTVPPNFHPVRTELGAEAAADEYDRELSGVAIDVALLGLGSDGHTASLFAHSPALDVRDRHVVATEARLAPWVERVTLTVEALGAAAHVVFLAVGEDKAAAARRAFDEPPSRDTPAGLVRGARTTAILDVAAAGLVRCDRG